MAYAELHNDVIVVHTSWNEKELIKTVPGARYDPEERVWRLPLGWAQCIILRGVFRTGVTFGDALTKWGWTELERRVQPALGLRLQTELPANTPPVLKAVIESWRV